MKQIVQATTETVKPTGRPLRLLRLSRVLLIGYLLVLLALMIFEEKLIFFPSVYPAGNWQPYELTVEDAWFTADDGTKLHGWFVAHAQPRGYVLISHGNGGNITHRADLLRDLHRLGFASLIFDYRGYGRSDGSPTEAGVLQDAKAASRWLAERAGISPSGLIQYGESLGGAVAVQLSAADGARALILENTFSSLPDVAGHHYTWLPVRLLMRSKFDSVRAISRYHGPLLQIHGDADTIVPTEFGRRLFAAANEPKRLVIIPGGDHNDGRTEGAHWAIAEFLDSLQPPAARARISSLDNS
jgi:uncharacterized protein